MGSDGIHRHICAEWRIPFLYDVGELIDIGLEFIVFLLRRQFRDDPHMLPEVVPQRTGLIHVKAQFLVTLLFHAEYGVFLLQFRCLIQPHRCPPIQMIQREDRHRIHCQRHQTDHADAFVVQEADLFRIDKIQNDTECKRHEGKDAPASVQPVFVQQIWDLNVQCFIEEYDKQQSHSQTDQSGSYTKRSVVMFQRSGKKDGV